MLSFGTLFKKEFSHSRSDKVRNSSSASSLKDDKSEKDQKDPKENYCVYCRIRGHNRTNCFKLKRKEKLQQSSSPSSSPVAAVDPITSSTSDENSSAEVSSTIASVSEIIPERRLDVNNTTLKVISLNNNTCSLFALLDTGSPISFISLSVYKKINNRPNLLNKNSISYLSISGDKIDILGSFKTKICLDSLPHLNGDITLNVLNKEIGNSDLILGRDYISENNIIMVYYPTNKKMDERIKLFKEMAFAVINEDSQTKEVSPYMNIKTDFGSEIDRKAFNMFKEVESLKVDIIDDDYFVKVALKDESTYAFAPRRFAWTERIQIREIVDDLLARDIIQISTSFYCARVVPVRKKNGTLRLCVDLRSLNDRVVKQKYPFPLIEDCLARLSFGFCKAPAEFQRRIVHVLQPLIRLDKVIVYIDDILIPSVSTKSGNITRCLDLVEEILLPT